MKNGKRKGLHPAIYFIILSVTTVIISGVLKLLNIQSAHDSLTRVTGEVESTSRIVISLFSVDRIVYIFQNMINSMVEFAPLSMFIISAISIAIAFKTGFLRTLFTKLSRKMPKFLIVYLFTLLCIISGIGSEFSYVLLLPIGAVLFMSLNRNPISGIVHAFAAISGGVGANVFLTAIDYNLATYTEGSSKLIDIEYTVSASSNMYFMIIMTFLLALTCTYVTEKLTVKKLGRNTYDEEEMVIDNDIEKRGLIASLVVSIIFIAIVVIGIIPGFNSDFIGFLLEKEQDNYIMSLFSTTSPFMQSSLYIFSILIFLQGFAYGIATGVISKFRHIINFTNNYLKEHSTMFLILFFAAQFIYIFKETNIGLVVTSALANLIKITNFSFIPLILIIILFTIIANLVLPGTLSKWAIFAPSIMPLVMEANINPEFAQLVFRAGDSISKMITPAFMFFAVYIGFVEVYTVDKNEFNMASCYGKIMPYFLCMGLTWLFIIVSWYIIGIPIGPNVLPGI
ncbi:MAG TPA: AbgT family transporter [Bacilli bacterium]|nr:AbgT family transporter [Bacilli bacterium]